MRNRSGLLCVAALVTLLSASYALGAPDDVGQQAPALIAKQIDGTSVLDLAAFRGKVVVLNFWASWCVPCRAEMPMLEAFYRKYQGDGIVVVGPSADDAHDRRDVAKAIRDITYPVALLVDAKTNGFGMPKALPITYVIDTGGVIRARLAPTRAGLTEEDLAAVVLPLQSAQK